MQKRSVSQQLVAQWHIENSRRDTREHGASQ